MRCPISRIDSKTYQRLEQFSQRARVSIQAAASDSIENWLDITSDPQLAISALSAVAVSPPDLVQGPVPLAPAAPRPNITYINARLGSSPHRQDDTLPKLGEVNSKGVAR